MKNHIYNWGVVIVFALSTALVATPAAADEIDPPPSIEGAVFAGTQIDPTTTIVDHSADAPSESATEPSPVPYAVPSSPVVSSAPVDVFSPTTDPADKEPSEPLPEVSDTEAQVDEIKLPPEPSPAETAESGNPHVTWWPDAQELPPFWVAATSPPGGQAIGCASVFDRKNSTIDGRLAVGAQHSISYDVIQWDARQSNGVVSIDIADSDCGRAWGISSSTPLSVWNTADASFVSLSPGSVTIDIDAMNEVRPRDDGRAVSIMAQREDGSVISIGMNITRSISVNPPQDPTSWSCFAETPAPAGTDYELPPTPPAYEGTGLVGQPVHVSLADLTKGTGWSGSAMAIDSPLWPSDLSADGSFTWTPTEPGVYHFRYHLTAPHCVLAVLDGTLKIAEAALPLPAPEIAKPLIELDEHLPSPSATLAQTGITMTPLVLLGGFLFALGYSLIAIGTIKIKRSVQSRRKVNDR
jgi:hypothetical protein